jgi:hypothetical protein
MSLVKSYIAILVLTGIMLAPGFGLSGYAQMGISPSLGVIQPASEYGFKQGPGCLYTSTVHNNIIVLCTLSKQLHVFNLPDLAGLKTFSFTQSLTGIALSSNADRFFITVDGVEPVVREVEMATGKFLRQTPVAAGACSPVLATDEQQLFVCNRFDNSLSVIDLPNLREIRRLKLPREPVAARLGLSGKRLVVANHLPASRGNVEFISASVSIIDVPSTVLLTNISLPNGSTSLRDLAISPDGRWAAVTHNIARFAVPTTQVANGWMNSAALSLIDLEHQSYGDTVYLDDPRDGAANPWAVAWSVDGRQLLITHDGTHEMSVLDVPALMSKLKRIPREKRHDPYNILKNVRKRIALRTIGPRALAVIGPDVFVAGYFSDDVERVSLTTLLPTTYWVLGNGATMNEIRRGEMLFNDASLCYQRWQSCATCHPDGRTDGLNWDLLNDGIGNPKNTRSLLMAHQTPPAMSIGIRETAEAAVRSGLRHILYAARPESEAKAIDAYLKSMKPHPSPFLERGELSIAAQRGKVLFNDKRIGCQTCHPAGLYTSLGSYDVGTQSKSAQPAALLDTPTLVECWRTAPYLHDGSALTIQEVITTRNQENRHGHTSHLTASEVNDLAAYVLSL